MFNVGKKIKGKRKRRINPIVAGVTGAVVGVGIAVVATQLKEEKTRKKVKKVMISVKDQAIDYVEALKTEPNDREGTHTIKKIANKKDTD